MEGYRPQGQGEKKVSTMFPDRPDDTKTQIAVDRTRAVPQESLEATQIASLRDRQRAAPEQTTRSQDDRSRERAGEHDATRIGGESNQRKADLDSTRIGGDIDRRRAELDATEIKPEGERRPPARTDDLAETRIRQERNEPPEGQGSTKIGDRGGDAAAVSKPGDQSMNNESKPTPTTIVGFGKPAVTPAVPEPAPVPPPQAAEPAPVAPAPRAPREDQIPVVGWLVVVKGPGRGNACEIGVGMNYIGREAHNRIVLDFGDGAISRERAGGIAFDTVDNSFVLIPGEGNNFVRQNDKRVLVPQELAPGDKILIGQTELRFVPLCGPEFSWEQA